MAGLDYSFRLFSYGTLQTRQVQIATFGRELEGKPDASPGSISEARLYQRDGRDQEPLRPGGDPPG